MCMRIQRFQTTSPLIIQTFQKGSRVTPHSHRLICAGLFDALILRRSIHKRDISIILSNIHDFEKSYCAAFPIRGAHRSQGRLIHVKNDRDQMYEDFKALSRTTCDSRKVCQHLHLVLTIECSSTATCSCDFTKFFRNHFVRNFLGVH